MNFTRFDMALEMDVHASVLYTVGIKGLRKSIPKLLFRPYFVNITNGVLKQEHTF